MLHCVIIYNIDEAFENNNVMKHSRVKWGCLCKTQGNEGGKDGVANE